MRALRRLLERRNIFGRCFRVAKALTAWDSLRNEFLIGRKENFVSLMEMLRFGIQTGFLGRREKVFSRRRHCSLARKHDRVGIFSYFMISTFFRKLVLGVLELMLLRTRNRARLKLWGKKVEQENPQHCCLCPINYNYVLNISSTFLVEGICSKLGLTRSDSTQIGFFSASSPENFHTIMGASSSKFPFLLN